METKIFKLVSGESVIAEVVEMGEEVVTLQSPMIVTAFQDPRNSGREQVSMTMLRQFSDDTNDMFMLPWKHVMFKYEPAENYVNLYKQVVMQMRARRAGIDIGIRQ